MLADAVKQKYGPAGTEVHLLCRESALAVVWSTTPIEKGPFQEVVEYSKKIAPIVRYIGEFMDLTVRPRARYDSLVLWVPGWKYQLDLWLPPGETRQKFIHTGFCERKPKNGVLRVEIRIAPSSRTSARTQIKTVLESWFLESLDNGFGAERLRATELSIEEDDAGVAFELNSYAPVSFPWVELYLRLRSELARKEWPIALLYSVNRERMKEQ
jgi:hypothetical protein